MTMAAVDDAPRGREVTLDREEDGNGDDRDWAVSRVFRGTARHPHVRGSGVPHEAITIIANREETSVGDALAVAALGVPVDVGPASRGQPAALMALGVPADEAEPYAEGRRRGATLVSVTAAAPQVDAVVELMERYATADLNED
jgi:hypothetical protein